MFRSWKLPFVKKEAQKKEQLLNALVLPEVLETGRLSQFSQQFTYTICGILTLALIWMSVAQIQELIIAEGQIIPSGLIKKIQHLEGGLVREVKVSEGDLVEKGDTLVLLQSTGPGQDLNQLRVRRIHLFLSEIRLSALIAAEEPDFSLWREKYPKIVKDQYNLYNSAKKKIRKEKLILQSKILQNKAELKSARLEYTANIQQAQLYLEKVKIKNELFKKRLTSREDYLEARTEYQTAKARQILAEGKLAKNKLLLSEANIKLQEAEAEARNKFAEEYSQLSRELAELEETINKFNDRVVRLRIVSPIRGIVQQLVPKAPGEVIKAGELVANVVSLEDDMIVQSQIAPSDIAQVKVGDKVNVKISAYDPNLFGTLNGTVQKISASTFQTKDGVAYYKAQIHLEKNYFKRSNLKHLVLPGMEAQAEIITGAKSLMKYMLKPIYRSLDTAFSER
ncbi:MAG: HlyD family type I secretion periplasmic adaptor subunit [Pseudomonadota bacterium]